MQRADALGYLAYEHRVLKGGDRKVNLGEAIRFYHDALRLRETHGVPDTNWAWDHAGLANAYRNLPAEGAQRLSNLESAITHYATSLKVFTKENFPRDWAMTQNYLGNAYYFLASCFTTADAIGEREQNLRLAAVCYRAALEGYRERGPDALTWAGVHCSLAVCLGEQTAGDRPRNLALMQASFAHALRVRTRRGQPVAWAATHKAMGDLYLQESARMPANAVELAIDRFQKALSVYRRRTHGQTWAVLQLQLGRSYAKLPSGHALPGNLDRARRHLRAATRAYAEMDQPSWLAWSQQHLGRAHRSLMGLSQSSRSERANRRCAVACFEAALSFYTADLHPATHAGLQRDLETLVGRR